MQINNLQNISAIHYQECPTSEYPVHTVAKVNHDDEGFSHETYIQLDNDPKWWSVHPHHQYGPGIGTGDTVILVPLTDKEKKECHWFDLDYTHWMIRYYENGDLATKLPVR